ncbi:hypothetical protein JD79_01029 [Geodermatophilus normandii]|uniref:Uncharacterized protein n=1 Tax=Geodermatophilus normandii TaxID=1137989 RepID=A0A317QGH7_9ACTN|nr:hypothetical protein [Geodermatophilus normandii]PWW21887.1 hypothetical protein JD79_01029 [Geodermatophilus normandii]
MAGAGLTLLVLEAGRRLVVPLLVAATAAAAVVWALVPSLVDRIASALRLTGEDSAAASDSVRAGVADQALLDFAHSPVRGIGLPVVADGHSIYLQLLAAGGALLFLGFAATVTAAAVDARSLARRLGALPLVLLVCTAVWLLVGVVENQLTDLYLHVPPALVAGLRAATAAAVPPPTRSVPAPVPPAPGAAP